MATAKKNKQKGNATRKVGLGVLIAGAAAAAVAGTYFLYGSKHAPRNRKKVKGWMLKARGEVLEGIEKMRDIDMDEYHKKVDQVMRKYEKMRTTTASEVGQLKKELKSHWNKIEKEARGSRKRKVAKK